MEIRTAKYEMDHGRKPKGEGYWAFLLTAFDGDGAYCTEQRMARGTLREALRQACRELKRECSRAKVIVCAEVLP
jgi:hypothetical protein